MQFLKVNRKKNNNKKKQGSASLLDIHDYYHTVQ